MRNWIGVASAEHVRRGRAQGFMQDLCHGKAAPIRRVLPGDTIIYYSPAKTMRGSDRLQAFTAIGTVRDGAPYQVEMAPGFTPWRRDVDWRVGHEAPIRPLLDRLGFAAGGNWGYKLRFGLFEVDPADAAVIAVAMEVALDGVPLSPPPLRGSFPLPASDERD